MLCMMVILCMICVVCGRCLLIWSFGIDVVIDVNSLCIFVGAFGFMLNVFRWFGLL